MENLSSMDVKNLRGVDIDNLIFELHNNVSLSSELIDAVCEADVAYLQDREEEAAIILDVVVQAIVCDYCNVGIKNPSGYCSVCSFVCEICGTKNTNSDGPCECEF